MGENPAALRAAVFSLSSKKLRGGGGVQTPPSRARVKHHGDITCTIWMRRAPPERNPGYVPGDWGGWKIKYI